VLQLQWHRPNLAGNLAGAILGQISKNGWIPDLLEPKSGITLTCGFVHFGVFLEDTNATLQYALKFFS